MARDKIPSDDLSKREAALQERLDRLAAMEEEVRQKEKAAKQKEKSKKQVLLRLSPSLWEDIAAWAEDDFRSINSQIEFLLSRAVENRKKK